MSVAERLRRQLPPELLRELSNPSSWRRELIVEAVARLLGVEREEVEREYWEVKRVLSEALRRSRSRGAGARPRGDAVPGYNTVANSVYRALRARGGQLAVHEVVDRALERGGVEALRAIFAPVSPRTLDLAARGLSLLLSVEPRLCELAREVVSEACRPSSLVSTAFSAVCESRLGGVASEACDARR